MNLSVILTKVRTYYLPLLLLFSLMGNEQGYINTIRAFPNFKDIKGQCRMGDQLLLTSDLFCAKNVDNDK